jgi:hypothetical protein
LFVFFQLKRKRFLFILFSSSYGSQQVPRRLQTFADQSIVVPQSYGSQLSQMTMPQRTFVSPQQQLFDQQQQLQQKIQESQVWTEAG